MLAIRISLIYEGIYPGLVCPIPLLLHILRLVIISTLLSAVCGLFLHFVVIRHLISRFHCR